MSVLIQGGQLRALALGVRVEQPAKTVPQNALSSLFTVSGGRVLITGLYGQVTTVIGGTTPSAKLVYSPTSGADTDMVTAVAITSDAVNTQYSLGATALVVSAQVGHTLGQVGTHLVNTGTIDLHVSAADATGAIKWTLTYIPLDDGASVAAA